MRIIDSSIYFNDEVNGKEILCKIEKAGRVCYKSENNITEDSSFRFAKKIIENGHESVLEHEKITIGIICDRGISHEIVRHRIASYSQESTRYCNYHDEKFGKELTFIRPSFWNEESPQYACWLETMHNIECKYNELIEMGAKPQEARSILPNSLKTEIVVTMNIREWRHFFKLRTDKAAHPQMRELATMILKNFKMKLPILFDDINC